MIGGHQRLVAARRLGLTSVPVTWLDINVDQARLLALGLQALCAEARRRLPAEAAALTDAARATTLDLLGETASVAAVAERRLRATGG